MQRRYLESDYTNTIVATNLNDYTLVRDRIANSHSAAIVGMPYLQAHNDWRVDRAIGCLRGAINEPVPVQNALLALLGRSFADAYYTDQGSFMPELDGEERAEYYKKIGQAAPALSEDLLDECREEEWTAGLDDANDFNL
mmetsp:Transcript_39837/g.91636  ORF Transcript_39837/g.91636 Transcript_39837/m.91636 type:complete len:140 (-) Transcript_39837:147-566(-)